MDRKKLHIFNMFAMKKTLFDQYCTWLFDILFTLENRIDLKAYSQYEARVFGFLSERLFNVWLEKNELKTTGVDIVFLEKINWLDKGSKFLKRKFLGKK